MKLITLFAFVALTFAAQLEAHAGGTCKVYVSPTCMSLGLAKYGYVAGRYVTVTNAAYSKNVGACQAAVKDLVPYCKGRDAYSQVWSLYEVNGSGVTGGAAYGYDKSTYIWVYTPSKQTLYYRF